MCHAYKVKFVPKTYVKSNANDLDTKTYVCIDNLFGNLFAFTHTINCVDGQYYYFQQEVTLDVNIAILFICACLLSVTAFYMDKL